MNDLQLIKVSGYGLDDPDYLAALAQFVTGCSTPLVIIHGGKQAIAQLQTRLGIKPKMIDGVRVTDGESLTVAQMVLSGAVNKRLVVALRVAGIDAVGISGVDGGLLRAQQRQKAGVNLGHVGNVVSVRADVVHMLLEQGMLPVISPISLGLDWQTYNVNADHAASALAVALRVQVLHFVSDVPGVLRNDVVLPRLTAVEAHALIDEGLIYGGMIPKVTSALDAVAQGVPVARVVDMAGLAAGGTEFVAD